MIIFRLLTVKLIFLIHFAFSECSDLSQADCDYWSTYCSWNSEQNICEEIGGGGGGSYEFGLSSSILIELISSSIASALKP